VSQGSEGNPPLRIRLSREQWAEVRRRAGDEHPATWARRVLLGAELGQPARPGRPRPPEVTYSGPPLLPPPERFGVPNRLLRHLPAVPPTVSIGPVPPGTPYDEIVAMLERQLAAEGLAVPGLRAGEYDEASSTWTFEVVRDQPAYQLVRRTDPDGLVSWYHCPTPEAEPTWAAVGTPMPPTLAEAVLVLERRRWPGCVVEMVAEDSGRDPREEG
jgi:hypothetical protein